MKSLIVRIATSGIFLTTLATLSWAVPGYHISDEASARRAVRQYAADSFKFRAVVYQAKLDSSLWRLALVAHEYLLQKPDDPQRECSFSEAYWEALKALWQTQQAGASQSIPRAAASRLESLRDQAVRSTIDGAKKMPNSVAAHLNYGNYLQYFGLMGQKSSVALMLHEYQQAVALSPNLGYAHYALANGYIGAGRSDLQTVDKAIAEYKKALELDPRLTNSYYSLAALYSWPCKSDFATGRAYLDKYLRIYPDEAKSPTVVPLARYLDEKLSRH